MCLVTDIAIRSSIYVYISVTNVLVGIAPTGSRVQQHWLTDAAFYNKIK